MQPIKHAAFGVALALTTVAGTGLAAGSEGESTFMIEQGAGVSQPERLERRFHDRRQQNDGNGRPHLRREHREQMESHGRNGAMAHRYKHQRRDVRRHRHGG